MSKGSCFSDHSHLIYCQTFLGFTKSEGDDILKQSVFILNIYCRLTRPDCNLSRHLYNIFHLIDHQQGPRGAVMCPQKLYYSQSESVNC